MPSDIERLLEEVLAAPKYRAIDPELVRIIGLRELAAHGRLKEALKETKSKLHQITAAYHTGRPAYQRWLEQLASAHSQAEQISVARQIMQQHASTRERLPFLERFYQELFATLPPVTRLLDLACGLNPLAHSCMPLARSATYIACDIDADMVGFVGQALELAHQPHETFVCDLAHATPPHSADMALILKTLPVLEQVHSGAGLRLLRELNVPTLIISFPAASLGGRKTGMAATYEHWFTSLVAGEGWQMQQLRFPNELVFVVAK